MAERKGESFCAGVSPLLEPNVDCLTTILQKLVAGWGSLPVNHECYDEFTCQMFSLHEIVEILVQVKVSQYLFDYVTQVPVYHVDVGIHGLIF